MFNFRNGPGVCRLRIVQSFNFKPAEQAEFGTILQQYYCALIQLLNSSKAYSLLHNLNTNVRHKSV
jgi:hypothetical protein